MDVGEPAAPKLYQKHRELVALIEDAYALRIELFRRLSAWVSLRYLRADSHAGNAAESDAARANADEQERQHHLFEAAVDADWPEELALYAWRILEFDPPMVKALLRIQEVEEEHVDQDLSKFSPKLIPAYVLGILAVLANQVPRELFKYVKSKGWLDVNYGHYRATAFVRLLFAVAYYGLMMLVTYTSLLGRNSPREIAYRLKRVKFVLVHIDALSEVLESKRKPVLDNNAAKATTT
jgi:hypothetical protein